MKVIVSSSRSRPPPKNKFLLSKLISLNLFPTIGSNKQPLPLPPVTETFNTWSISKSWGSTSTFLTLPDNIGSTWAVFPNPTSIDNLGGFNTS